MSDQITISNLVMTVILSGGLMGVLGQGVRSIVGLKKLRDQAGDQASLFSDNFSTSRFFASLFIGFIAGALTAFFMSDKDLSLIITKEMMVGFMAAGYAGADAIEGFASKIIPGKEQATTKT